MPSLTPDETLIALLYFLGDPNRSVIKFRADREAIHRAIYNLRESDPKALRSLPFRQRYFFPESYSLDQALANLEATGLLERRNDEPRYYFVVPALREAFLDFVAGSLKRDRIRPRRFEKLASSFALAVST